MNISLERYKSLSYRYNNKICIKLQKIDWVYRHVGEVERGGGATTQLWQL